MYLIVDVVIHISYGRISFMFKEILASRNGGTREYVHFQVHPTNLPHNPIPSRAIGKWAETKPGCLGPCPLHFPKEEFKFTLQIILTNRNVMVFAVCGSPHGVNVNLDGCMHVPPAEIPKCTSEMLIYMLVKSKHSQQTANSKLSPGEQVTCVAIMLECLNLLQGELPILMCVLVMRG